MRSILGLCLTLVLLAAMPTEDVRGPPGDDILVSEYTSIMSSAVGLTSGVQTPTTVSTFQTPMIGTQEVQPVPGGSEWRYQVAPPHFESNTFVRTTGEHRL